MFSYLTVLFPGLTRLVGTFWLALLLLAGGAVAGEDGGGVVRIGVLSVRTLEDTGRAWTPTALWLTERLPGYRFQVVPLYFEGLAEAARDGQLDFVLTNPEHYVLLHAEHGLSAIVTLMPRVDGHPLNRFGGVILTRAGRRDLRDLSDLQGRRISAVSRHSLGGYLAQRWTLLKAGLDSERDVRLSFTGMPHEQVLGEVRAGRADAGFVRTGVLEAAIRAGRYRADEFKVLNLQPGSAFPLALSTDLYPEWPLAALPRVSEDLRKAVALALLDMPSSAGAAQAGGYFGFTPTASYDDVEAVMVRLGMHPYRGDFGWRDVVQRYAVGLVAFLALLVILAGLVVQRLRRGNQALQQALAETDLLARRQTLLLDSLGEGVYGIDRSGRCTFINPAALAMLGYSSTEVIGQDQHRLFHHHREDGRHYPHEDCPIHQVLGDGRRRDARDAFVRKNGEFFPVRLTATPIREGEAILGAVVVFQDIGEEQRRQERLRVLEAALQASANGVVITNTRAEIEWANPAVTRLTGYSLEESFGQNPRILRSGVHDDTFYQEMWRTILAGRVWHGDLVNRRKDGSLYDEEMTITPVRDEQGEIRHYIAVKQDIGERKRLEAELRRLAASDPLTGIANRRHFLERLDDEWGRLRRYGGSCALLMLDLDHFKRINDTWGHAVGDQVLRHFTALAAGQLRSSDSFGRLGGEEFACLLPETALEGAREFAERLRRAIAEARVTLAQGTLNYTVSIGVARLHPDDPAPDTVLARADAALYRAKENGRDRVEVA